MPLRPRSWASLTYVLVEKEKEGDLVATACEFAERWVSEGKGRSILEHGLLDELDRVNQREGQQLTDAMFSKAFWAANLRRAPGWK